MLCLYDMFIPRKQNMGSSSGYRKGVTEAKLKVAINGFGRIGRNFLRCWHGRKDSPFDIIAINDTGGVKQASHLLKYDSTLGIFDADVKPSGDAALSVDGKIIKVVSNRNPSLLPWKELGIDIVIEGTGVFVDREGAGKHRTCQWLISLYRSPRRLSLRRSTLLSENLQRKSLKVSLKSAMSRLCPLISDAQMCRPPLILR
ncbi:PREDICTED: glyceraldehyde-3-phosphate dehydrogenase GAPA1, chloroplastic isoform X2 [Brassica oleracea var. oleracea]|uniref:glyceraldehyde-3-phosphate dehydrogenase GAPA1, chloroplastic isoform X2 n=1 Tax=Brassica oleracea var. oleracea TaxID=109376 RepID=UPI0006A6CD7D|nr:PREDICTED: glyceraldehyde-3-phosphate dehydrogenase GAPA1, chloroplastic isoform X2 [Brassica oleracea var. oleracea]